MRIKKLTILTAVAAMATVISLHGMARAADIFVDDDFGNACPGSGTLTDPFCTIQAAIDDATAGDTINVAPGLYLESPIIDKTLRLKAVTPATEANVGDDTLQAIIDGNGAENTVTVSPGVSGVIIDGFEITNPMHKISNTQTAPAGILVQTDNAGGGTVTINIRNNVIHEVADPARAAGAQTFGEAGIVAFNIGNGSTISGNTIFDISDSALPTGGGESPGSGRAQGILVKSSNSGASGITIDSNVLHDVQDVAIRFNGVSQIPNCDVTNNSIDMIGSAGTGFRSGIGIDHLGSGLIANNQISNVTGGFGLGIQVFGTATISGNSISSVAGGNGAAFPGAGIFVRPEGSVPVVSVTGNEVSDNEGFGILLSNVSNSTVDNNEVDRNGADGIVVGSNSNDITRNKAEDNTGDGFVIAGESNDITRNVAKRNGGNGFTAEGDNNDFTRNRSQKNDGFGFEDTGTNNDFTKNNCNGNISGASSPDGLC